VSKKGGQMSASGGACKRMGGQRNRTVCVQKEKRKSSGTNTEYKHRGGEQKSPLRDKKYR